MIPPTVLRPMNVVRKRILTPSICEFTLEATDGQNLPAYEPGSHVTVETPSKAMRRYSLANDGSAPTDYVIAIKREPASRGGSISMHEQALPGTILNISMPENSFPLMDAPRYLLIAGGIGITPIYAMAQRLAADGKHFQIIYCTRTAEETAYLEEMTNTFGNALLVHHDQGNPDKIYDFWDHFAEVRNMHIYCCGPQPLMDEIKAISGHWPESHINFEDFKPVDVVRGGDVAFEVTIQKSGRTITIPANRSILEAVRDAGVRTVSSCESGTCGSCKSKLIEGCVDHRDMVLMDEEKSNHIMLCVSRAKSGGLVIDL
ncbi:MAG: PDR/VanB family oxidoreductase [Rhizobiaceae bacterium]